MNMKKIYNINNILMLPAYFEKGIYNQEYIKENKLDIFNTYKNPINNSNKICQFDPKTTNINNNYDNFTKNNVCIILNNKLNTDTHRIIYKNMIHLNNLDNILPEEFKGILFGEDFLISKLDEYPINLNSKELNSSSYTNQILYALEKYWNYDINNINIDIINKPKHKFTKEETNKLNIKILKTYINKLDNEIYKTVSFHDLADKISNEENKEYPQQLNLKYNNFSLDICTSYWNSYISSDIHDKEEIKFQLQEYMSHELTVARNLAFTKTTNIDNPTGYDFCNHSKKLFNIPFYISNGKDFKRLPHIYNINSETIPKDEIETIEL